MSQIQTRPDITYTILKGPWANNDQECPFLEHTTVRSVPAHVPHHAPCSAYTCNDPYAHACGHEGQFLYHFVTS
jgi:hypothetical protein